MIGSRGSSMMEMMGSNLGGQFWRPLSSSKTENMPFHIIIAYEPFFHAPNKGKPLYSTLVGT